MADDPKRKSRAKGAQAKGAQAKGAQAKGARAKGALAKGARTEDTEATSPLNPTMHRRTFIVASGGGVIGLTLSSALPGCIRQPPEEGVADATSGVDSGPDAVADTGTDTGTVAWPSGMA